MSTATKLSPSLLEEDSRQASAAAALSRECRQAVAWCREQDWNRGFPALCSLLEQHAKSDVLPGNVYSYLGYCQARFEHNLKLGLGLCRRAIKISPEDPDNYLNLARVHLLTNNRRLTVRALRKGLALDPRHPELGELRRGIGQRRRPVVPFLSRDNPINQTLGRLRSRLDSDNGQIERSIW